MSTPEKWVSEVAQVELERFLDVRCTSDPVDMDWAMFNDLVERVEAIIGAGITETTFTYHHPVSLQPEADENAMAYPVRMQLSIAGKEKAPLILCLGGIANSSRRFDILARFLGVNYRVASLDWAGRAGSGWLREVGDYGFESSVAQARAAFEFLGGEAEAIIGSSVGGNVGIRLIAETPGQIKRLVLNDVGFKIPVARRRKRARVIGRHYLFGQPRDLFRRTGAAQKQDGPVEDAVLLHNAVNTTRWSKANGGRVYRHDIRALLAYRSEAMSDLDLHSEWSQIQCPVLILHGMLSDNLTDEIWKPMAKLDHVCIRHVPATGHTPVLSDRQTAGIIGEWLAAAPGELPREATLPELPNTTRRLFVAGEIRS